MPLVEIRKQGLAENRYVDNGNVWAASTLIQWCKEKEYPVFELPLAGVCIANDAWGIKTIKDFIFHSKRVNDANLDHPVILDSDGFVCDGWHRVAKAILNGNTTIKAIRIQEMPLCDGYEEKQV